MSNREPTPDRLPKKGTGAPWGPVYGEILTFDDPEIRLPAIDRLEGFHPGGPCLGKRNRTPGLALCGGRSLDRELQGANRQNLALNPKSHSQSRKSPRPEIAPDIAPFYCMIYHLLGSVI